MVKKHEPPNKQLEEIFAALEMLIHKRFWHVIWTQKETNEEVLKILKIKQRKIKYFGYIKR
uniref:Uncharacterized protein n=1 Tax=Arion vulgaris TaxID=1028688 RepID=A0A0B7BTZ6_9EUPU